MNVILLAHTQLNYKSGNFYDLPHEDLTTDGQVVSLAAIRTCYSHKTPLEILNTESEKYFGDKGKEGKRLFKQIVSSGHTSTLEHINFTFAIEGVSRSLLAQLTRHRHMSFSVQSQRYVKLSSESRSGGFEYVEPQKLEGKEHPSYKHLDEKEWVNYTAKEIFETHMHSSQDTYNKLIECGVPQEDARSVLPNAATCNLVLTANLRTFLDFYKKRKPGNGAQHEITQLAVGLKNAIVGVEPWTEEFFEGDY